MRSELNCVFSVIENSQFKINFSRIVLFVFLAKFKNECKGGRVKGAVKEE